MSRTIVEQTDASVSLPGGVATVTDAAASGGTYSTFTTGVVTITVPTGVDAVMLLCTRFSRTAIASVTVDGALQPDQWVQDDFTTATATGGATWTPPTGAVALPVAWYKSAYRPILFANTAVTHTIVIGVVAGTVSFDAYEKYAKIGVATGAMVACGHSIALGSGTTTPATNGFNARVASMFSLTLTNLAASAEALMGGNVSNGTAGWSRLAGTGMLWDAGAALCTIMHGRNDSYFFGGADPGGGAGYVLQQFLQRMREVLWRIICHSPLTKIIVCGLAYEDFFGEGLTAQIPDRLATDQALSALCSEASVRAYCLYVNTWNRVLNEGGSTLIFTDHLHPNDAGAWLVAREVATAVQWATATHGVRI